MLPIILPGSVPWWPVFKLPITLSTGGGMVGPYPAPAGYVWGLAADDDGQVYVDDDGQSYIDLFRVI